MYRKNYVNSLRKELLETVSKELSPIAMRFGYSKVPLEANIRWKPMVLLLGNYSSGKSTLINELLGGDIQSTGQAPTDDSFTVITGGDNERSDQKVVIQNTRDGQTLLNDPQYPFEILRHHGDRFASHFRMKRVSSPLLSDMALIDTPGMLDSVAERDRGYNYQEVIRDLAQLADMVLVLFDPHKAGTVRESYESLRETLPKSTFEDRVHFVLNRIDECSSLPDLLRVYGTLCWNLSQMTGRKDIPPIHLTYSPTAAAHGIQRDHAYLNLLENERETLKSKVLNAPAHRLDHLASYIEMHGQRLSHYLEALTNYTKMRRVFLVRSWTLAFALASLVALGSIIYRTSSFDGMFNLDQLTIMVAAAGSTATLILSWLLISRMFLPGFHRNRLVLLDQLTKLDTQSRRDSWQAIRHLVKQRLSDGGGRRGLSRSGFAKKQVERAYIRRSSDARKALSELTTIPEEGSD